MRQREAISILMDRVKSELTVVARRNRIVRVIGRLCAADDVAPEGADGGSLLVQCQFD